MTKSSQEFRFGSAFGSFFHRQITSAKKKDIERVRLAKKLVRFLLEGNIEQSKWLGYDHQGKRQYRKGDLRIVFAHCEECRKLGHEEHNGCEECADNSDDTLRFFAFGHRKQIHEILASHQIWKAPNRR